MENHYQNITKSLDALIGNLGSEKVSSVLESLSVIYDMDGNPKNNLIVQSFSMSHYGIDKEDLINSSKGVCPTARMVCMHLLHREFDMAIREIGRMWDKRENSVHRFVVKMDGLLDFPQADMNTVEDYKEIKKNIDLFIKHNIKKEIE